MTFNSYSDLVSLMIRNIQPIDCLGTAIDTLNFRLYVTDLTFHPYGDLVSLIIQNPTSTIDPYF